MDKKEGKLSLQQTKKQLNSYARYSSIAVQMAVIITLGVFGGKYLDEWLQLKFPIFILIFSVLSVALAVYLAIKDLIKFK